MRTNSLIRLLFMAFLLALPCCGEKAGRVSPAPEAVCPVDMVWVEKGGFCIDRYEFPNKEGAMPVRDIDYGEAMKLCILRGKRLPTEKEFKIACSGEGNNKFIYGDEYMPGKCRDGLPWADGPAPSGSYPECNVNGISDLSGNVWEWVTPTSSSAVMGRIAGGAWNTQEDGINCGDTIRMINLVVAPNVGVRCALTPPGKTP